MNEELRVVILATGARVERFDQEVNTFDPFGLFDGTGKEQKKRVETRVIRNAERAAPFAVTGAVNRS